MRENMDRLTRSTKQGGAERKTLRQLGVPGTLAMDLEAALGALGKTEGSRVVGFTFVTPDGERHDLKLEGLPSDPARERAA